jgi:hypothetical protein
VCECELECSVDDSVVVDPFVADVSATASGSVLRLRELEEAAKAGNVWGSGFETMKALASGLCPSEGSGVASCDL